MRVINKSFFRSLSYSHPVCVKLLTKFIKYLPSLIIAVFCLTNCSRVPINNSKDYESLGAIYGRVFISKTNESLKNISVFVLDKPFYSACTDSNGFFYIPAVPAGKYSIIARKEGFADSKINNVDVAPDSITLLSQHFISNSQNQSIWDGIKIKRVNINKAGIMKGSVVDAQTNIGVANAVVIIEGTPWVAYTNSTGNYILKNILPGTYNLIAFKLGFHKSKILNMIIEPDQTSLVNIQLVNVGIPEDPLPYNWEPAFIKN